MTSDTASSVTLGLFGCFEPHTGRRQIVTDRRTKRDFAELMRTLVNAWYPEAAVVRVVLDQLNTHTGASRYEAFAPAEARRILERLEFYPRMRRFREYGRFTRTADIVYSQRLLSGHGLAGPNVLPCWIRMGGVTCILERGD